MLVAGGQSLTESYRIAYDAVRMKQSSVKVEASRLAKKPHIARAIKELRKRMPPEQLVSEALDEDWVIEGLQALAISDYAPSRTKLGALQTLMQHLKMV